MGAVANLIRQSGKSLSQIARESGCSLSNVSRIRSGTRLPSLEFAAAMSRVLGIPLTVLLEATIRDREAMKQKEAA